MLKNAAVIGAGTMGSGIALQFALNGTPTILCDLSHQALEEAKNKIKAYLDIYQSENYHFKLPVEQILNSISYTTNLEELADVDFITECVTENLAIKQSIFQKLDVLCKEDAIFASNTSSLKLSDIYKVVTIHKSRCILTHWFNPPHIVPLVELLKNKYTADDVYESVDKFLKEHGKVTIEVKKEVPGLVANRIQIAMAREVLSLLEEGVASPEDLDIAVTGGPGFRLALSGLLEIMDFGGIDVWNKVIEGLQPEIASHSSNYKVIENKIERGDYGVKTGRGFYKYPGKSLDEYTLERDKNLLRLLKHTDNFLKSKQSTNA